jgi:hypothetical protein
MALHADVRKVSGARNEYVKKLLLTTTVEA